MFKQAEYIFDSKQRVFVSIIFLQEVKELQIFFLMGNKRIGVAMDMEKLYTPSYPLQLKHKYFRLHL